MKREEIELLAPAGSYEGFEAALGAGADAVYVGGSAFGARAYARNFNKEELIRAIETAHIHDKKLYLTVNTLFKNRELKEQLYEYLLPFYEAGLDAVIVQDLGALKMIRETFPGLSLHASTQMTVTGPEGMSFLEKQGAARVVPARELSLAEIEAMHKESPIEIETFVHGALCYSYSGQCLMSSILGGRSGNRGRCAQPCRLPYETAASGEKFKGGKELCPLSLKDISTIEILPQILNAGVTSLKIEGRMKQPNYTAGVTSVYRKYLDLLFEKGEENYRVSQEDKKYLLDLFNRGGSCKGYYQMQNGPSMLAFSNEKKTGEITTEIKMKKEPVQGNLLLYPGSPAVLNVSCRGFYASACGGEVQFALKQPLDENRIRQQMDKLGNTPFVWESLEIETEGNVFIPVKVLNEVRREALAVLKEQIVGEAGRAAVPAPVFPNEKKAKVSDRPLDIYVSCENAETADTLFQEKAIKGMYLSFDCMKNFAAKARLRDKELYLSLPHIMRGEMPPEYLEQAKTWLEDGMAGFLVRNIEEFAVLAKEGLSDKCVTDHNLYTWNDEASEFFHQHGVLRNTVPLELNEKELRHRNNEGSEMVVYGYLPLMTSAQCVQKNLYGCNRCEDRVVLKDRYDKKFPSVCYCNPWKMENTAKGEHCYNIIYNSIPYGLLKEKKQVEELGISCVRLSFTMEKPEEAVRIYREFKEAYVNNRISQDREFTKGHFKRGAE